MKSGKRKVPRKPQHPQARKTGQERAKPDSPQALVISPEKLAWMKKEEPATLELAFAKRVFEARVSWGSWMKDHDLTVAIEIYNGDDRGEDPTVSISCRRDDAISPSLSGAIDHEYTSREVSINFDENLHVSDLIPLSVALNRIVEMARADGALSLGVAGGAK